MASQADGLALSCDTIQLWPLIWPTAETITASPVRFVQRLLR
jgi:hypothetical protein